MNEAWELHAKQTDTAIGYVGENQVRQIVLQIPGTACADWEFHLDLVLPNMQTDIVLPDKQVTEQAIELTWNILDKHTAVRGELATQLRATKGQHVRKSQILFFLVNPSVAATEAPLHNPSEIEQIEQRLSALLSQAVEEAGRAADEADRAGGQAAQAKQEADRAAAIDAYTKGAADARYGNPVRGSAAGRHAPLSGAAGGTALSRAAFTGATTQAVSTQGKNLFDAARFVAGTAGRWNMDEGHYVYAAPGAVTLTAGTGDGCSADKLNKDLYLRAGPYTLSCVSDQPVVIQLTSDFVSMNLGQEFGAGACTYAFTMGTDGYLGVKLFMRGDLREVHLTKLQLESGNAATAYEPFVPTSPSPDYPAPLTGIAPTVLTMTGKNISGYHTSAWGVGSAASWSDTEDGKRLTYTQDKADAGHGLLMFDNRGLDRCQVTVSYDIRVSRALTLDAVAEGMHFPTYGTPSKQRYYTGGTEWQRITITGTLNPYTTSFGGGYNLARIAIACQQTPAKAGDWVEVRRVQVEFGETATAYEPYGGQTLALPALEPLYGDGTVADEYDAATGVVTRRWRRVAFDGSEGWSLPADGAAYLLSIPGKYQRFEMMGLVCSHYPTREWVEPYYGLDNNWDGVRFWVQADHPTLADWQAFLAEQKAAGTPVTVLYELAEPAVTHLDPRTIRPVAGDGFVFADQGNLAITYSRDTGGAIDAVAATAHAESAALHTRVDSLDGRYAPALHGTAAGRVARVEGAAAIGTLTRAAVDGTTTATGTGSRSPDNPYTLAGITPTALLVAGNNQLPRFVAGESDGITVHVTADGGVRLTGRSASQQNVPLSQAFPLSAYADGVYTLSLHEPLPAGIENLGLKYTSGIHTDIVTVATGTQSVTRELTLAAQSGDTALYAWVAAGATLDVTLYPQLERGTARSTYVPPAVRTIPLPALEPLYGDEQVADEYDAVTGVLTRRWRRLELDGTEGWSSSPAIGAYSRYTLRQPGVRRDSACDCTVLPRGRANGELSCAFAGEYFVASVPTADYADVAAWKAYLAAQAAAGTPVTVLYELAEPVVTQLEARTIRPAAGDGYVYADQGSLAITYSRDTGGAIDAVAATAHAESAALHTRVDSLDGRYAPALHGTAAGQLARLDDVAALGTLRRAAIRGVTAQVRTTTGKNLARRGERVETIAGGLRISHFPGGMLVMPSVTLPAGDYVLSFVKLTDKPTTSTTFSAYINGVEDLSKSITNFNLFETGVTKEIPLSVTETSTVWLEVWGNAADEVIDYQLQLEAGNAATAYEPFVPTSPTPDYPAPIGGAAPTVLTMTGKNLLPLALSATQSNGVTVTDNPDGTLTLTGTATADTTIQLVRWNNRLHSGTYTLSLLDAAVPGVTVSVYFVGTFDGTSKTFAWTSAPDKIAMIELKIASGTALSGLIIKPQLEVGTNKTAYEPYTPIEAWLPAFDPLYGDERVADEYDAVTGTLTRRWGRVALDGTENWTFSKTVSDTLTEFYTLKIPYEALGSTAHDRYAVSSHYPFTFNGPYPHVGHTARAVYITDVYDNAVDLNAYLAAQAAAGTPVTVLYQLAEPAVTRLDPQTLVPPAPVCNLYADAGTVAVGYQRDPTIVIDRLEQRLSTLLENT